MPHSICYYIKLYDGILLPKIICDTEGEKKIDKLYT